MRLIGKIYAGAFVLAGLIGLSGVTYADNFEIRFGSVNDAFVVQEPGGTSLMDVLGTGNVCIGTTSPDSKLSLVVDGTAVGNVGTEYLRIGNASGTGATVLRLSINNAGYSFLQSGIEGVSAASLVLQPQGGNVGIGTASPAEKTTIVATTGTPGLLVSSNSAQVGANTSIRLGYNSAASGGNDNWANARLRAVTVAGGGADVFLESASVSSGTSTWNTN